MKKNNNLIHIVLIVLGSIFITLSCFHSNMWFDESYSIAIAKRSFQDIWIIGSKDVHPVLYYILLKIVLLISNNNLIYARLFSVVPIVILSIIGFTHINRDFGNKVGLIFSMLILISPACIVYAGELRMYTWAMLFVSIMALYCFRIVKYNYSIKNWIIFSVFSLLSAYTHYYALLIAGIINIGLFVFFIVNKHKNKEYEKYIRTSIVSAIVQVLLYLPWFGILLSQTKYVSETFWPYMPTPLDLVVFLSTGFMKDSDYLPRIIIIIYSIITFIFVIYLVVKNWKNKQTQSAKVCVIILGILVLILLIACALLWKIVLYPRYFLNIFGLIIFAFSMYLSRENKFIISITIIIVMIFSMFLNISLIKLNYDESNSKPYDYIANNIKNDDIVITNSYSGFTIIAYIENDVNYRNMYFYNLKNWRVEEPYKAYGKTIFNLDDLQDYKGRMWVISDNDFEFQEIVKNELNDIGIIEENKFDIKYQKYNYTIALMEKY